jgi:anti-anti-sigma regulatory factor
MSYSVRCEVQHHDSHALVRLHGALTTATASHVRLTLLKCLAEQPDALLIDLAGLRVGEARALSVFTAVARQAAMWPGTPLLFCAPTAATRALLARGAYDTLPVFVSTDVALAAGRDRVGMPSATEELLPVAGAARQARDVVTEACARWELSTLVGPASVVVSELVSNAVAHAHTMITLRLSLRRRYLHIAVRDGSTDEPRPATTSPLAPGTGRGLLLVDAIARRWGSMPTTGGKVVWAVLSTDPLDDRP